MLMKDKNSIRIIVGILLLHVTVFAQQYPTGVFQSPMDTPLFLSAPFGSLRDNHFHSGMDIRTYEKEGLPIYAIADGYVSRIKYSAVGYGKALYIQHPNGYSSVYGHLQNAHGTIAAYIKKYQYEIEQFEFDHFPSADKLTVKKGDTIGWSGNSGGSTGPHLHFEIRDTKTEEIINPQLFGILPVDSQPPTIRKLYTYIFEESGSKQLKSYALNVNNCLFTDSGTIFLDTVFIPLQCIGFGVEAFDYHVGRKNEYSIYGFDVSIDNKRYYQFRLDRFVFAQTRSINLHIDYASYKKDGIRIQKLFTEDGNNILLYPYLRNKGKYYSIDTLPHWVKIVAYDCMMKPYIVYAIIKPTSAIAIIPSSAQSGVKCYPNKVTTFKNECIKVTIPENALYDTLYVQYDQLSKAPNMLSYTHKVHSPNTPLQKNIQLSFQCEETIKPEWYPKLLVAYSGKQNNWRSAGGEYENGYVVTKSNVFGYFALTIDTTPPVILPLFKANAFTADSLTLSFKITDDFSGILSYRMLINGKWVLAEYDAKNDLIHYVFDENTPNEKLTIELYVTDKKNNTAEYKIDYSRPK
jgi:murein DD-endopeptidase MepM/ murein hydrolase activator NlpD